MSTKSTRKRCECCGQTVPVGKLTPAEMAKLYRSGRSIREIAALAECHAQTVHLRLQKQGIQFRPPGGVRASRRPANAKSRAKKATRKS